MSGRSIRASAIISPSERVWRKAIAFGLINLVCASIPKVIRSNPDWFSLVWLSWALVFGLFLTSKPREWVRLAGVILAVDALYTFALTSFPVWAFVGSRLTSFSTCFAGAWLVRRLCGGRVRLRSVREVLILFLVGVGALMLEAAGHTLCQARIGTEGGMMREWMAWFFISLLGFAFVVPGMIFWADRTREEKTSAIRASLLEIAAVLGTYAALVHSAVLGATIGVAGTQSSLLLLLVWASLRLGPMGVVGVHAFVVTLAAFFPIRTYSYISGNRSIDAGNVVLVLTLIVTSFAGMLFAVAVESQRRTKKLLAANNEALEKALAAQKRQTVELKESNTKLQEVLRRAENLTHDLAAANQALSRSDRAKLDLVRAISHELRNPLSGARMMAGSLARSRLGAPWDRQVANLRSCVDYLQTLLDETLDITQVESGQMAVRMETFTPAELLEEVASMFESMAREKGLAFVVDKGRSDSPVLLGDKTHTKRILINYLSNAVKFTTTGSVGLRCRPAETEDGVARLRFEVEDTGPGVSPAVQDRLFSKFVRESSGQLESRHGAGLGLALCRQLAELAGGSVGFASIPGKGSTFWALLPFIVQEGMRADNAPDDAIVRPEFGHVSVCVVDDDPMQLEAMSAVLGQFGVIPDTLRTPAAAFEAFQRKPYDVAFLDYHLGEQTGLQLRAGLRDLRGDDYCRHTRFHLVTALPDENLDARTAEAGFEGAHRKPVSLVTLFRILREVHASGTRPSLGFSQAAP